MGIREAFEKNPAVGAGIAVVLVVLAVFVFARSRPKAVTSGRWYYDLTARQLVAFDAKGQMPPVKLPSGNEGVMAHVFSCGKCNSQEQFIGYLESLTEEGRRIRQDPVMPDRPVDLMVGQVIARPPTGDEEIRWIPAGSDAAPAIMRAATCPGGKRPEVCIP